MNSYEFEITIQRPYGDNSWPVVARMKQPDGLTTHTEGRFHLSEEDFQELTELKENAKEYGIYLGKALFRDDVERTFVRALSKSQDHLRILLSLETNDKLRTLHWERLCAPIDSSGNWNHLARDQRLPFSLYIPTIIDRRFPPIGRRDLRALVLVASPSNLGKYQLDPFDVEAAVSSVQGALGEIPCSILANDIEGAVGAPTLKNLCEHLTNAKKPYTMLHFICHGRVLSDGETALYWAKEDNQAELLLGKNLLGALKDIGGERGLPHFLFLCTCESAEPEAEDALGGLAQRLVRELGMPAVVAMTRKVSVQTALALGQNFYQRLRVSGAVDLALQEATAGLGDREDATVPALFSRLGGRPLFSDRLQERGLTDGEIEFGLQQLRPLLHERAPNAVLLWERFERQVEILENTEGAEATPALQERIQALEELNSLCNEVLDISFDALAALGKEPPPYKAECPFRGLSSFTEKDHKFFFGRYGEIKELERELKKDNFLAVLGFSGSGKSSLVRAGLFPTLNKENPDLEMVYLTPTDEPLEQLQKSRALLSADQPVVYVVDQFEELFTLCSDDDKRKEFIQTLLTLAQQQKVIITMRWDFLEECFRYPNLKERINRRQKLIEPMTPEALGIAIKQQADQADLRFEEGVRNAILAEVEGEPGAMPLLQYALLELWNRRRGRWLCYEEYEALGGLREALGHTAEQCYEHLLPEEQAQVRNIFLRLTRVDEGAVPGKQQRYTRLRVELEALTPVDGDSAATKKLVNKLANERLVITSRNLSTGKEVVEVAHEAIFEHWPRLQNWLNENLKDLQVLAQIRQAEQEWNKHRQDKKERDNYLVHRGERLKKAQQLAQPPSLLNKLEQEYVSACGEREKRARLNKILGGCAVASFLLVGGWVGWDQVEENKIDNWDGSTKISDGLLERAVSRAKQDEQQTQKDAQKNKEEEQARKKKDEENAQKVLHDYQKLLRHSVKYADTLKPWAEQSLARIISLYRLPQLEQDLKNQQFGQLSSKKLQDYENQFTKGALQTTYAILMREMGAKADTNDDGKINNLEEARQLPCDTLKEMEIIWRKSTENHCGFYGENSFYQAPKCTQLNGRTLTETVFFVTYDPIIERLKSCNIVPKEADPYQ